MKSEKILDLLESKHGNDIFIPNCKTGSTWHSQLRILDAWTMRRSWANPLMIGYEIKVNRGDFLRDNKWMNYLPYCNEFYFVCPTDLIQKNELSPEIGLMWVAKTGSRLYTKKKAAYRTIEDPVDLYNYILMCRTFIKDEHPQKSNAEYWSNWLKEKDERKYLGCICSKKIKELLEVYQSENNELKRQIKGTEEVKKKLEERGMDIEDFGRFWFETRFNKFLKEVETGIPEGLECYLENTISDLNKILSIIKPKTVIGG